MPYELPDEINADWLSVCVPIPNDVAHQRAFLGQIADLAKYWTWDKDDTKTKARDTAAVWWEIHKIVSERLRNDEYCGDGNDMIDVRQKPGQNCILEKNIAGQWVQFANLSYCTSSGIDIALSLTNNLYQSIWQQQYDGNPSSINPNAPDDNFNGDDSDNRNLALCLAAFDWFSTYLATWLANEAAKQGVILAVTAILAGLLLPIGVAVGIGLLVTIIGYTLQQLQAAAQEAVLKAVVCSIVDELAGSSISAANFEAAGATVLATYTSQTDEHALATLFAGAMAEESNYLSFVYELGKAYAAVLTGAELECPCSGDWCIVVDLTTEDGGFVEVETWGGVWASGQGWLATCNSSGLGFKRNSVFEAITFDQTTIRGIELTADIVKGSYSTGSAAAQRFLLNGVTVKTVTASQQVTGNNQTMAWEGNVSASEFQMRYESSGDLPTCSGSVAIKTLKMWGNGPKPDIGSNCPPE